MVECVGHRSLSDGGDLESRKRSVLCRRRLRDCWERDTHRMTEADAHRTWAWRICIFRVWWWRRYPVIRVALVRYFT